MSLPYKEAQRLIQINREPEINPNIYSQLIYNKGGKSYMGKGQFFSYMELGNLMCPKKKKKPDWMTILQYTQNLTQNL